MGHYTKIEVQSTFKDFQEQMKQLGRGKLAVELREFDVKASPQDLLVRALSYPLKPKETYVAIVAYNPSVKDGAHRQLAEWKPSLTGYPCLIAWADSQRYCQDKEALERALAELVNDPVIGEKLLITMSEQPLPPPSKETKGG